MAEPRFEIRPLGAWTGPATTDRQSSARFRARWPDTLDLLLTETGYLGAGIVVIQVDVTEGEVRRDGMLRAGARVGHPGVRISFSSIHGPLAYATDTYDTWRANVRAIALALTALRAVDRYGITRSGEQYRGWTAIESTASTLTVEAAARLLAEAGDAAPDEVLGDPVARARAWRRAARRYHPDAGGDAATFARLSAARDLLEGRRG